MTDPLDRRLSEANERVSPPAALVDRIEARLLRRPRRLRIGPRLGLSLGAGLAAAAALALAAVIRPPQVTTPMPDPNETIAGAGAGAGAGPVHRETETLPPRVPARVALDGSRYIANRVETSNPNVTIVMVYPAVAVSEPET